MVANCFLFLLFLRQTQLIFKCHHMCLWLTVIDLIYGCVQVMRYRVVIKSSTALLTQWVTCRLQKMGVYRNWPSSPHCWNMQLYSHLTISSTWLSPLLQTHMCIEEYIAQTKKKKNSISIPVKIRRSAKIKYYSISCCITERKMQKIQKKCKVLDVNIPPQ